MIIKKTQNLKPTFKVNINKQAMIIMSVCYGLLFCTINNPFPASVHSPVLSSALSSVASKWDLPVFTLPFNILVCLHIAATGANHPYFPVVQCCYTQKDKHIWYFDTNEHFFPCNFRWISSQITICTLLMTPSRALKSLRYNRNDIEPLAIW